MACSAKNYYLLFIPFTTFDIFLEAAVSHRLILSLASTSFWVIERPK